MTEADAEETPILSDLPAWQEGHDARSRGADTRCNPYRAGDDDYAAWLDGYLSACDAELRERHSDVPAFD